ncbi:hypothetical protein J6590_080798 [Homalodisca vitripennis]|nr:hypothetical protein J6590_080798 [Homalodisca vitripennis]
MLGYRHINKKGLYATRYSSATSRDWKTESSHRSRGHYQLILKPGGNLHLLSCSARTHFVLQPPSSRVASDLLSLSRSMSSWVIGLIMGHGHLRKHLHRVGILQEDPLCRMCDEQDEHLFFDCPTVAREWYAIFGSLDKGGEFPQEDLIRWSRLFSAVCGTAEIIDW